MGKGRTDKGKSRNNAVFKVAVGKVGKGKPKAINANLKNIKLQNSKKIESLNSKFTDFQQENSSVQKAPSEPSKITPIGDLRKTTGSGKQKKNYEDVIEDLEKMK
eukprot:TRINITY_DN4511_c0_g1_i2.p1 TRINITY_DN4511_c0_g1~~TRINITY_DN4511_c0_g1_i2.p1  ORF type:complete len:105 (-),score=23.36 TRINITY_DN4511_c0_g1_i2:152-466(-)